MNTGGDSNSSSLSGASSRGAGHAGASEASAGAASLLDTDSGSASGYFDPSGARNEPAPSARNLNLGAGSAVRYEDLEDLSVDEMKEMFALFDFHGTGHIATEDLGTVLRGLGKNLTQSEISRFINQSDKDGGGKLNFQTVYSLLAAAGPLPGIPSRQAVLKGFRVFDTYKRGKISAPDFYELFVHMGEPMPKEDVEALIREIGTDGDNQIDIEAFVDHMIATSSLHDE